jgi:hypothetical protein
VRKEGESCAFLKKDAEGSGSHFYRVIQEAFHFSGLLKEGNGCHNRYMYHVVRHLTFDASFV